MARPTALDEATYLITEADLDNIDRTMHDLSDLIAPLRETYPQAWREGCALVARLDRVVRRAESARLRNGGAQ